MMVSLQERESDEAGVSRDAQANDDSRAVTSLVTSVSDDVQMETPAERRVTRSTIRQQQSKSKWMTTMMIVTIAKQQNKTRNVGHCPT